MHLLVGATVGVIGMHTVSSLGSARVGLSRVGGTNSAHKSTTASDVRSQWDVVPASHTNCEQNAPFVFEIFDGLMNVTATTETSTLHTYSNNNIKHNT